MYLASTISSAWSASIRPSSAASASALVAAVTGRWWNGSPYDEVSDPKSGWFDTTPVMSTGSVPLCQRNSRSFRQCPSRDTMIRVRTLAAASCSRQVMWNDSATQEKSRSSFSISRPGGGTVNCTRMKNRPSGPASAGCSPYCWLDTMLAECWTRKLDTAYTMPGLSGQDSVSTYATATLVPQLAAPPLHVVVQLGPDAVVQRRRRELDELLAPDIPGSLGGVLPA
jgi:hypothetical protein